MTPSPSFSLTTLLYGYKHHHHQGLRTDSAETSPTIFRLVFTRDLSFYTMSIKVDSNVVFNKQEIGKRDQEERESSLIKKKSKDREIQQVLFCSSCLVLCVLFFSFVLMCWLLKGKRENYIMQRKF